MALDVNALVKVADVKTYLGIQNNAADAVLELLIGAVSGFIDEYTGRVMRLQDGVEFYVTGTGTTCMVLPQYPCSAITSIADEDGNDARPTDLKIRDGGILKSATPWKKDVEYSVAGTFGYMTVGQVEAMEVPDYTLVTVPPQLAYACIKLAARAYERRQAEGTTNVSANNTNVGYQRDLDVEVTGILDKYRKYV